MQMNSKQNIQKFSFPTDVLSETHTTTYFQICIIFGGRNISGFSFLCPVTILLWWQKTESVGVISFLRSVNIIRHHIHQKMKNVITIKQTSVLLTKEMLSLTFCRVNEERV
jgi:hypothetical protein